MATANMTTAINNGPDLTYSLDWNDTAKTLVTTGLNEIPVAGNILSGLVSIFWPASGENVWGEIQAQVEQLVDNKISELVQENVQNSLQGLIGVMNLYTNAIKNGDSVEQIWQYWSDANTLFVEKLPSFQASADSADQLMLLPLFAQFANLHLSLLRDGVLFGSSWGMKNGDVQDAYRQLTNSSDGTTGITPYTAYANQVYQQGYQMVVNATPTNYHECQPFLSVNNFARQMTLSVNDYTFFWQYFDTQKYPNPVSVWNGREIYSDPMGRCDDSGPINLPSPPTQPISQIEVWSGSLINAVQVTYPTGGGPNGETQTPVMGIDEGSSTVIPVSSSKPIVVAAGLSGNIVNGLEFYFNDASHTDLIGGGGGTNNEPGGNPFSINYLGQILSSIHINGVSNFYDCADCVVFGFQFEQSQTASLEGLRRLYIASPTSASLNDLATRNQAEVDLNQLKQVAAAENWDAQRQEYWKHVQAQVANQSHK